MYLWRQFIIWFGDLGLVLEFEWGVASELEFGYTFFAFCVWWGISAFVLYVIMLLIEEGSQFFLYFQFSTLSKLGILWNVN